MDNSGIQTDRDWNVTSMNMSRTWYKDQPYVLASQAQQVFYINDMKLGNNWHVVERVKPRSFFYVPEKEEEGSIDVEEPYQEDVPDVVLDIMEVDEIYSLRRDDCVPLDRIDAETVQREKETIHREKSVNRVYEDDDFIDDGDIEEASCCDDDIDRDETIIDEECDSD
ncbi:uncharacterized protein LOC143854379 isoform X7 [Tasmannia lanceolata]|uniref:uncharacterized protein LOC143854379 isoform X7 n=1 Tax=Tasmannia lanceolata TaxID=3420 RepID=UPI00406402B3